MKSKHTSGLQRSHENAYCEKLCGFQNSICYLISFFHKCFEVHLCNRISAGGGPGCGLWDIGHMDSALGQHGLTQLPSTVVHKVLPSLLSLEGQSGSGPDPRAKFQIVAGLGEQ